MRVRAPARMMAMTVRRKFSREATALILQDLRELRVRMMACRAQRICAPAVFAGIRARVMMAFSVTEPKFATVRAVVCLERLPARAEPAMRH